MGAILSKNKRETLALFRMMLAFSVIGWLGYLYPGYAEVFYQSIRDAYVGVTVWVAFTLALFYYIESYFNIDFGALMTKHKKWQVFWGAVLGGLPGCGGAIVITTHYVKKNVSFGTLVATLTATMGDAAFLLIAASPKTAGIVMLSGVGVGIISGYITDALPLPKWLNGGKEKMKSTAVKTEVILKSWFWQIIDRIWMVLLIPGAIFTAANAVNIDANEWFKFVYMGFADDMSLFLGVFTLSIFFSSPTENNPMDMACKEDVKSSRRVVAETSFISAWVILGFALYDTTIYATGWDLKQTFVTIAPLAPFIGVAIGWLPGCGPQIVVTTLYINGIIPFSALMGNAISNDGDALFPALVLAPRAGILATVYSTIPALILAYSLYFCMGV